jgi:cell division protein FtsI (penicillin-binding protein 3)
MDAATIPFGQGMSATNVQMAAAMSVIANGGVLMRPVLVRRVVDGRGETVDETLPEARRRVVPRDTARLVADMLTAATGPGGTGAEAVIDGYLVAGKTGTAQKADYVAGGYAEDQWVASFAGFVPAESPRIVISVVIDEPVIVHSGGQVAAPVFRRVGEATLRHLGVPAATGGDALAALAARRAEEERVATAPADATAAAAVEETAAVTERVVREGEAEVPECTGMTARAALVALFGAGMRVELAGSGIVTSTYPAAGSVVPLGTAVRVTLAPPEREPAALARASVPTRGT